MQPARPDSAKIPSRPAMPTASWPCAPRPPRRSCALLRPLSMKPDLVAFCDPKIASRRGLELAAFVLAADILLRTGTHRQLRMRPSKIDAGTANRSLFNINFHVRPNNSDCLLMGMHELVVGSKAWHVDSPVTQAPCALSAHLRLQRTAQLREDLQCKAHHPLLYF